MIYLASPYSHPDPLIMRTRFLLAEEHTAQAMNNGEFIFSPIVHCHELAQKFKLPTDFNWWSRYNMDMLRRADRLRVLCLPEWDASRGVQEEVAVATKIGIPVQFWKVDHEDH